MELYIHIPFCVRKCAYCDFLSFPSTTDERKRYAHALRKELQWWGEALRHPTVETVFIGGGTPSWLEPELMEEILQEAFRSFQIREDAEITMEANPGTVTGDAMHSYRSMGINRLSIGLQSTVDSELQTLGRIHDYRRFLHTYDYAIQAGFTNINIDLMTGIPGQTVESLRKTLQRVVQLRPAHISAYDLIIEEGTPFYQKYHPDEERRRAGEETRFLPDEDQEYDMTKLAEHYLTAHGYRQYEISNFARPGKECRHNIGYWTRKEYLGTGLGAASLLHENRWNNTSDFERYIAAIEALDAAETPSLISKEENRNPLPLPAFTTACQRLSRQDAMEEFMFLGLRMLDGVSMQEFREYFGTSMTGVYGEVLRKYEREEMLLIKDGRVMLTERGRDVSNEVLADFLF